MRECTKCKKLKITSEFYGNKTRRSGLSSQCKKCDDERHTIWRTHNPGKTAIQEIVRCYRIRKDVMSHYSKGRPKCKLCMENDIDKLTIDHVSGGGNKHREETNNRGRSMYVWLKAHNYPFGFRVLCGSCQLKVEANKRRMAFRRKYQIPYPNLY